MGSLPGRELEALGGRGGVAVTNLGYVDVSEPDGLMELLWRARQAEFVAAPRGSPATLAVMLGGGKVEVFVC